MLAQPAALPLDAPGAPVGRQLAAVACTEALAA